MSNVISIKKLENTESKVEGFVTRNRAVLLSVIGAVVAVAIIVCVVVGVSDVNTKKGLAALDVAEYEFTSSSADLSETEVADRQSKLLDAVNPYLTKKGVVGVRANMLASDVAAQKKDFESAVSLALAAVDADKKAYTAPVCYFNAASYCEELGKTDDAAKYYEMASSAEDFLLAAHALFSCGRVNEALEKYDDAVANYNKVVSFYSGDTWADLAQSRLVALKANGKVN